MAVSRKAGSAVRRNAIKRRLREVFRTHRIRAVGVDVLVIPLADSMPGSSVDAMPLLRRDFTAALDRLWSMLNEGGRR